MMSLALVVFFVSATATAVKLHGVAPTDQIKYAGEGSSFKCLTDGAVFPLSVLNDDFCDCADGTDEPGTSACAGRRSSLFYCPNEGSAAVYLYASRVNDGICDCCDGSDEWLHAERACPNVCEAEGDALRRARAIGEAERVRGNEQRRRLIDSAVVERQRVQQDLVVHQRDLVDLEAAEVSAAAALDVAKKALEALQPPATSQSLESEAALRVEAQAAPPTEPAVTSGGDEGAVGTDTGSAGAKVSEYAKWMEGAESSLGNGEAETASVKSKPVTPSNDVRRRRRSRNPFEYGTLLSWWEQATEFFSNVKKKWTRSPEERAMDSAKGVQDNASKLVSEKRRQIHDVEKRLKELSVDDDQLAYALFAGRCFTKKLTEYKYEVCFFKTAKQDSTSLGNWLRWESPGVGLFTNGQHCPKGPKRSLRVIFRCGTSEDIEEVSEPSRCAYEATIAHPAACSDEPLHLDARPRLPMEEL